MNTIEKLSRVFTRFPGIGPRQAKRFVYHLLRDGGMTAHELGVLLAELPHEVKQCGECFRYHTGRACALCSDFTRDEKTLLVVATDADLEAIERSHNWGGRYFVLGGTVPIMEKEPEKQVRTQELLAKAQKENPQEIVLAFAANMDGDHTVDYLRNMLAETNIKVSVLGRGLSTGSELEYADPATIKSALEGRR